LGQLAKEVPGTITDYGWGGNSDCADGVITLSNNVSCTAEFVDALIFEHGFETGSTVGWSNTVP